MKSRLAELLVDPVDRTNLELVVWEQAADGEITTGLLVNRPAQRLYPIHAGVPRMLVFATGVSRAFADAHAGRLAREWAGFSLPHGESMPGEGDVLRSFSAEWTHYGWDGNSYWNLDPATWFQCMRFMLDTDARPIRGKLALEVGIGIGGVADHNARVEGAEVVGVDLGYAVDAAYAQFGSNPSLHIVQASVFALPFRDATFDFVYSFGVIHHTFDTKIAFDGLARLPKRDGRLYVWVYSPEDESRNVTRRVLMKMEQVIRPITWRLSDRMQTAAMLPLVPLYIGYQQLRAFREGKGQVRYGFREALHAARDRFTPRYIHRHTDDEVMGWFRAAGYDGLVCASRRAKPDWVPIAFTACTGVDGVRGATAS